MIVHPEKLFVSPDPSDPSGDSAAIQAAVDAAEQLDIRRVVIPAKVDGSVWRLNAPIRLPSSMTVILDAATLDAVGVAFMNARADDPDSKSLGGEQSDLFLIGRRGGCIRSASAPQILLSNVRKFRVSGLSFVGGEGVKLHFARKGRIQRVRFDSCRHALTLTEGCVENIVEDVLADTLEESILICGGDGKLYGRGPEIRDSILCRIRAKSCGAPAVLLRAGSVPVRCMILRDLTDDTEGGACSVLIGQAEDAGEIRELTVRGVRSKRLPVETAAVCDGIFFSNLHGSGTVLRRQPNSRELCDESVMDIELPQFPAERDLGAFYTPNSPEFFGKSDAETIQNAINAASAKGLDHVVIPRWNARLSRPLWDIDQTIRLPDNMTLELWGCHMRQADFCYCNMFCNKLYEFGKHYTAEQENRNITITGVGDAVLDGGVHNGLLEKTQNTNGFGIIRHNCMAMFHNVSGITVENLRIHESRYYGLCFRYCDHGHVANIDYDDTQSLPNRDGCDVRVGCHDFLVEDITGSTGDDVVALNNLGSDIRFGDDVEGKLPNTANIHIRNLVADACRWFMVRLLIHDGHTMKHITIESLLDVSHTEHKHLPSACVAIGAWEYFSKSRSVPDDLTNVVIRDVCSRATKAIAFGGCCRGVDISNIHVRGDGLYAFANNKHAEPHKVYARGVFHSREQKSLYLLGSSLGVYTDKSAFDGMIAKFDNYKGDAFVVEDVFADTLKQIAEVSGGGSLELKNCAVNLCGTRQARCGDGCSLIINGERVTPSKTIPF